MISVAFKKPPVARKFSEDGPFELYFEHITVTSLLRFFFAGKIEGANCTNCWKPFIGAHARIYHKLTHQPQVRRQHCITNFACKNKNFYKVGRNQKCRDGWIELLVKKVHYISLKRAETRNLPNIYRDGRMEALARKQGEHIPQHCYIVLSL